MHMLCLITYKVRSENGYGFLRPGLKRGMGNGIFWSEIGSGFGDSGGTPPPKIPRSTPPPSGFSACILLTKNDFLFNWSKNNLSERACHKLRLTWIANLKDSRCVLQIHRGKDRKQDSSLWFLAPGKTTSKSYNKPTKNILGTKIRVFLIYIYRYI